MLAVRKCQDNGLSALTAPQCERLVRTVGELVPEVRDAFATSASHHLPVDTRNGDNGAQQEHSWGGRLPGEEVATRTAGLHV